VEELTRHLALSLRLAGDKVEVWTLLPDDSEPETVEILDDLVVRRLPMPLPATNWPAIRRSTTTGPRTLVSLRSAVAAFRPDVLHVQCFGPNGTYATALSRVTGIPLVVTLQGETMMDDTDIFEESRSLRTSLRLALRRAAAVTACSAFTLADAEHRFGLEEGRGQVIFNGVSLEDGRPPGAEGEAEADQESDAKADQEIGQRLTGVAGRPYILALGRIVEKKGFDLLLEAYAGLDPKRHEVDLVIAGAGGAVDALRQQAAGLGVEGRVHLVGRLDRQAVAEAMTAATLFVMPSRVEPFGIVILEAWRAGVAVVASNRGGAPEFVRDGQDGVLVDPFDTSALTAALDHLLADPVERNRIAAAGPARVDDFSWLRIAAVYGSIYRSVVRAPADDHRAPSGTAAASGGVR
jgi:phosphatidylinositol alpha-mannosyltransferase/D-inositol-3-phosphate glycosyltransferase